MKSSGLADKHSMLRPWFLTLLISAAAHADWKIGTHTLAVSKCPHGHCLISTSCLQQDCLAKRAWQKKHKAVVGPGGSNPGSAVCQKIHQAGVVIAMNDQGGSEAFCRFADGSLITLDGLWHW